MKIEHYSKDQLVNIIMEQGRKGSSNEVEEHLIHELISGRVSENINDTLTSHATFGERVSDRIAKFGGSWGFIISFFLILIAWFFVNTIILGSKSFDPYPFILLNLVLSCLAAIQAPVILMSQNRQASKDRLAAENDYIVNLKTELLIENLHLKLDELDEIKRIQSEILTQIQHIDKK